MAGLAGGSAFVRLQRPEDNLSQSLQFIGAQQAKQNEAAEEAKAKAKVLKEAQDKAAFERYSLKPEDFKVEDAGFQDVNADNINYANQRVKISTDYLRQAQEAYAKGDRVAAEMFRNKSLANQASFSARMATMKTLKDTFDNYQKQAVLGKMSGWNTGYENFFKAPLMGGKTLTVVNDKGEDVYQTSYTDQDGKVHNQIVSGVDVKSGAFNPIPKQDIQGDLQKIAKSLKGTERKSFGGGTLTTRLLFDKTTEASARQALQPMLNSPSYVADIIDQNNMYDDLGIDRSNTPSVPQFTKEQKKAVEDKMIEQIKGQFEQKIFNERDYRAEELALRKQQLNKPKPKTKADEKREALSKLYYDTKQATEHGDYSILLGSGIDPQTKKDFTVTKVVESPDGNYLIPITDTGKKLAPVIKSEDGILAYKLRNKPEYKGITVSDVQAQTPLKYRETTTGAADITALAEGLFDAEGNPTVNDEEVLAALSKVGITGKDIGGLGKGTPWDFGQKLFTVNGKTVDISNKETFKQTLNNALGKGGSTQTAQPKTSDPLGLGL